MTPADRGRFKVQLGVLVLVAVALVGGPALAIKRSPRIGRLVQAAAARWREMNSPDTGRDRVLDPEVIGIVGAMKAAGWRHYAFASRLENDVALSPFIHETAWPIVCRLSDDNLVGFVDELRGQSSCAVIAVIGELALGHCRP